MAVEKNKGGRPEKYSTREQLEAKTIEYFTENAGHPLQVAGLAAHLGITTQTLLQYEKDERFSSTIKEAKTVIESDLAQRALEGKNNATMSIFLLKNNFGYKDKHETEHSGSIDIPSIKINIVKSDNPIANNEKDIV